MTIRIAPAPSPTGLAADLKTAKTEVVAVIPANSKLNPLFTHGLCFLHREFVEKARNVRLTFVT